MYFYFEGSILRDTHKLSYILGMLFNRKVGGRDNCCHGNTSIVDCEVEFHKETVDVYCNSPILRDAPFTGYCWKVI